MAKGGIQTATIRPNVEKLQQRQRHKTGLHCAEEIEQLIMAHKRKHNEMPHHHHPQCLPCSPIFTAPTTHRHAHRAAQRCACTHSLLSSLSSSISRDDQLILDKLSCTSTSSFNPKFTIHHSFRNLIKSNVSKR